MALSGSSKTDFSGYSLIVEWSATQDYNTNKSKVTAKVYLKSNSSDYTIRSTSSRKASITIDGNRDEYTVTAYLSGNQKKLLGTKVYEVSHSTTGEKSVVISGTMDMSGISLSGRDYGTVSTSKSYTLNTIPRASTISSSLDWKAPRAFPISINKASSNFRHTVKLYVKRKTVSTWTFIKQYTGVDSYIGGGFEVDEMKKVFQTLANDSSGHVRVILETYNGSSLVGSVDYDDASGSFEMGEVVVEYSSKLTTASQASFNVGESVHFDIARNYWTYTHVIAIQVNGTTVHTSPVVEFSYDWNPTAAENKIIYDLTKNSKTIGVTVVIQTLYEGVQVDKLKEHYGTATVVNSEPTFGTGYTYKDSNAVTVTITGNDQKLIQDASTLQVTIPSAAKAIPKNSASIVRYEVTVNGVTKSVAYSDSDVSLEFGKINAKTNQTIYVNAVDSRGYGTQTSRIVEMLPYQKPSLGATVRRANGFEASTIIAVSGSIASLDGKNAINATSGIQYRYKENIATASFPTAWSNVGITVTGSSFKSTFNVIETLDQTRAYVFEVRATDKLGTTTVTKLVLVGVPSFFVDDLMNSIGVGMFPRVKNAVNVKGSVNVFNPNNDLAEAALNWSNDQARIRVGGTGAGAVAGFEIQGTGDIPMLKLKNAVTLEVVDSKTLKLGGSVITDYEIAPKAPVMKSQWTEYFGLAYFKTREGIVFLQGMMRNGLFNNICFTLPAEAVPKTNQVFYVTNSKKDVFRFDIKTDGTAYIFDKNSNDGSNEWVCLNGVYFTV